MKPYEYQAIQITVCTQVSGPALRPKFQTQKFLILKFCQFVKI